MSPDLTDELAFHGCGLTVPVPLPDPSKMRIRSSVKPLGRGLELFRLTCHSVARVRGFPEDVDEAESGSSLR
jgi:hypothetical protein